MLKNKIKAAAALVLAVGMTVSSVSALAFTDVSSDSWANKAITEMQKSGYINGYIDGSFRPDEYITRAEFVTIVNNMNPSTRVSSQRFADLDNSSWYYNSIGKGVAAGYIAGYDDNTVRPEEYITRAEAAVIAYRAWKLNPVWEDLKFADTDEVGPWAKAQVAALTKKEVIKGYSDNTFRPQDNMTRAEVVQMLYGLKVMSDNIAVTTSKDPKGVIDRTIIRR